MLSENNYLLLPLRIR